MFGEVAISKTSTDKFDIFYHKENIASNPEFFSSLLDVVKHSELDRLATSSTVEHFHIAMKYLLPHFLILHCLLELGDNVQLWRRVSEVDLTINSRFASAVFVI